ncbi:hypothetical protein [Arenicella xantha]|uniref:Uncharacterized protein n=1 Tax=Arenicella xantha TaxID=644221 RepID=A0A395JFD6_9GAMM|nr:hypothetical protein [Arenicella xantha]RBP48353.1 hypothetical protein DFR28_10882 [Arenicella xantha]
MSIKVRLKDIRLNQLDNECLRLVNRFTLAARSHDGTVLRVQEKDILMQISAYARATKDPTIRDIYSQLKQEILRCMYADMRKKGG